MREDRTPDLTLTKGVRSFKLLRYIVLAHCLQTIICQLSVVVFNVLCLSPLVKRGDSFDMIVISCVHITHDHLEIGVS